MKANEAKLMAANESPVRTGELGACITDSDYEQWERIIKGEVDITRRWKKGHGCGWKHSKASR